MNDKIKDAIQNVADVVISEIADPLLEGKSTNKRLQTFTYDEMVSYYQEMLVEIPTIDKCIISIMKESEYTKTVKPDDKWVIRQFFLDENGNPFPHKSGDGFYGRIVTADAVDMEFSKFMNGNSKKTFRIQKEG